MISSRSFPPSETNHILNCLNFAQRKARLESAKSVETSPATPAEVVDEGPKKYKIVVSKKGDKTTYPKKGDKVRIGVIDRKIEGSLKCNHYEPIAPIAFVI